LECASIPRTESHPLRARARSEGLLNFLRGQKLLTAEIAEKLPQGAQRKARREKLAEISEKPSEKLQRRSLALERDLLCVLRVLSPRPLRLKALGAWLLIVDDTPDALFENHDVKVDEQPDLKVQQAQVRK
jgi:hypothetical protein